MSFELKTKEFDKEVNCEELSYDDIDCSVKFFTMADGETGSWSAFDCAGDIPAIHHAYVACEFVGINNLSMITSYKLYPNPVNNSVATLTLKSIQECTGCVIELLDLSGVKHKQIRQDKLIVGQQDINIQVSGLTSGLYYLIIQCPQGSMSLHLLLIHR